MEDFIWSLLTYLVLVLANLLVGFLIAFIRAKAANEKITTIKSLALDAVRYAQERNENFSGIIKWGVANEWLTNQLLQKGIKITQDEIDGFIHSALKEIKVAAGDSWKVQIPAPLIIQDGKEDCSDEEEAGEEKT